MLVRTISGAVLTLILLAGIIPGSDVTLIFISAISLMGLWELYRVIGLHKSPIMAVGFITVILYYGSIRFLAPDSALRGLMSQYRIDNLWWLNNAPLAVFALMLIVLLFFYVFSYPKYNISQIAIAYFGFFYVAFMISCIYLARMELEYGNYLVWLIFLISWGSDTSAYCVGSLIGKHRLAPVLSPKKSKEGAVGGIVGAMLFTAIYCIIVRNKIEADTVMIIALSLVAGVGAVISMVGDLAASAIKRNYDVKDYAHLIPGHGGILDRFDSVIITAPIVYFVIMILQGAGII